MPQRKDAKTTKTIWLICVLIRQQNMRRKTLYISLFCESFHDILSNNMTLFLLGLVDVVGWDLTTGKLS